MAESVGREGSVCGAGVDTQRVRRLSDSERGILRDGSHRVACRGRRMHGVCPPLVLCYVSLLLHCVRLYVCACVHAVTQIDLSGDTLKLSAVASPSVSCGRARPQEQKREHRTRCSRRCWGKALHGAHSIAHHHHCANNSQLGRVLANSSCDMQRSRRHVKLALLAVVFYGVRQLSNLRS